jgi:hypothetical protein
MKTRPIAVAACLVAATAGAALLAPHGCGRTLSRAFEYGEEHEATRTIGTATCGVERWPVKTLTDRDRARVVLAARTATIRYLGSLAPNAGGQSTRSPLETRSYAVTASLTKVKRETDSDYHLVLTQGGASMIAEMPFVGCDPGARARFRMALARSALDATLAGPVGRSWRSAKALVRVTGVLFFDFPHGQSGHAPNFVELHPVTSFRVLAR